MKFLCIDCDEVMGFAERQIPGDGTLAAVFTCPSCSREIAMLTNPMETQLVSSLGVKIGGRGVPAQPMELTRSQLAGGRADAFEEGEASGVAAAASPGAGSSSGEAPRSGSTPDQASGRVVWSEAATDRLGRVPSFVRGMVKRIYTDYARERSITEITPEVMDRARTELGLEGM